MLEVEFGQFSDPGRVRAQNEDRLGYVEPATPDFCRTHGWLFALADGVGGQVFGELASAGAVDTVLSGFRGASAGQAHTSLLQQLTQAANTHVYEIGRTRANSAGAIATTLLLCALRFDRAVIAHVGDSRCYLIRGGEALSLTRDHSVANEHVRLGLLSPREAAAADNRHILTRSIGSDLFVAPEVKELQILPGDLLLLCSDGLHGCIDASEIPRILSRHPDLDAACKDFVNIANERDGSDNISIQLIRIKDVERMGMYRGRPYKLP